MKLYEAPRKSKIRVINNIHVPPCAPEITENEILEFDHIDGAYSFCKNSKGEIVHLSACTEVEVVD